MEPIWESGKQLAVRPVRSQCGHAAQVNASFGKRNGVNTPKGLHPVSAHSSAYTPPRAFSVWRAFLFNDGHLETALPLFIFVLTAQKNTLVSRPRLPAFSFYQIILKSTVRQKTVKSGQAGVVPQYLPWLLLAVTICDSTMSPGLRTKRTAVSPQAPRHSTPDPEKGMDPHRSASASMELQNHPPPALMSAAAATHVMDLGRSHIAVNQTDKNSVSCRWLSSRRWHAPMISLSQNHKIFTSPCVPASFTLVLQPWW